MNDRELTLASGPAILPKRLGTGVKQQGSGGRAVRAGWLIVMGFAMLPGCVTVSAPDKPIVIELNINIKQEVVYKLDKGVGDLINQNSEIF